MTTQNTVFPFDKYDIANNFKLTLLGDHKHEKSANVAVNAIERGKTQQKLFSH